MSDVPIKEYVDKRLHDMERWVESQFKERDKAIKERLRSHKEVVVLGFLVIALLTLLVEWLRK